MYIIFKVYVVFDLKFKSYSVKPMIEKKMNLSGQWSWQGATGRQGIISWSQLYRFRCPCCSFNLYWLYNDNFWDGGLLLSSFIIADIFTKFSLNRLIALLMFITVITYKSTYNINFFFLISRHFIKHVVTITTLYIYICTFSKQSKSF